MITALRHPRLLALSLSAWVLNACQPAVDAQSAAAAAATTTDSAASRPDSTAIDPNAWRREIPRPATTTLVAYPNTERRTLQSGLALYAIERASSTLTLGISCKAGSSYDPPGHAGTSGLLARLLQEGTRRLERDQLAVEAERLGTDLETTSTEELLTLRVEVLPGSADAALRLLSEVLMQPGLRAADFERVRREWLDQTTSQRDDPSTLARLVARRALLGPSAGQSPFGTPAQARGLTAQDLRAFHAGALIPARCAVLSAGALSISELETLAQRQLGAWANRASALEPRKPAWATSSRVLFVERAGAVQMSLFLASRAPGRDVPGFEARHLVNTYFGGLQTSRVVQNLRERHAFTYGVYSKLTTYPDFGVWSVETDVKSETTLAAVEELLLERQRLTGASPASADELARAKATMIQGNHARLEHTNHLFAALQVEFAQSLSADYFATVRTRIEDLTLANVSAQLPHFSPSVQILALVGPQAALQGVTGWFNAPIEVIDATWLDDSQ